MRRATLRTLMVLVGLGLLAAYAGAAYLGYRLLAAVWLARTDLLAVVAWTTVFTVLLSYFSYRFGTDRLLARMDAVELPRRRAPNLHARFDRLCETMGVGRPRLLVGRMAAPNAMAVGGARQAAIVLDRRLLGLLSADEMEALLAHELAHVESRDSLVQTLAFSAGQSLVWVVVVLALPFVVVAAGLRRALDWLRGRPPAGSSPLAEFRHRVGQVVLAAFTLLTLAILAHSRKRELAADDRAASVTGRPLALARALRKIERATRPRWSMTAPLYVHGDDENRLTRLLSTHPSMDERVERLVERADRERGERERSRVTIQLR